ncbi:HflC protein [hydrothermal vent metagenome]|uniref:HflC protein n=1 Tax=hydrothermal vent metagenome TaxID=652676 RepID=A0A3B0RM32_9ZZZZ
MKKAPFIAIIIAAIVIIASQAFFTVDQTRFAMVVQLGKPVDTIKDPGLHFKTPFIQKVIYFDNRRLIYDARPSVIITKDKKNLVVDNYARWQILDPLKYYRTVKNEIGAQTRLDDIIFSNLREELGKRNLIEIVAGNRTELMKIVTKKTNTASKAYGISVLDVRIKRADLPPENERAVYERMRAEREREAKKYRSEGEERALVIRAVADKEKTIILSNATRKSQILKGAADAAATKLYAEAYSRDAQFFYFLKTMEAYKKTMSEKDTLVTTPNSEFFRYMKKSK